MKTIKSKIVLTVLSLVFSFTMFAQVGGWNPELISDSKKALQTMIEMLF